MNKEELLKHLQGLQNSLQKIERMLEELEDQQYNYTIKGKKMKFVNGYFVDKDGNEFHGDKL